MLWWICHRLFCPKPHKWKFVGKYRVTIRDGKIYAKATKPWRCLHCGYVKKSNFK